MIVNEISVHKIPTGVDIHKSLRSSCGYFWKWVKSLSYIYIALHVPIKKKVKQFKFNQKNTWLMNNTINELTNMIDTNQR